MRGAIDHQRTHDNCGPTLKGALGTARAPDWDVGAIQRERILSAMAMLAGERGFAACSVETVSSQAGVSRRTFYEQFDGLEDCFLAVLDCGADVVIGLVLEAFSGRESWLDGLRWALASLLVFFDSEPLLARVWLVESMAAGGWAIEHRERRLHDLFSVVSSAWPVPDGFTAIPLAAEGVFSSVRSLIVQRVMARDEREGALIELLGPLMGLVAAPFVSQRAVRDAIKSGDELARTIAAEGPGKVLPGNMVAVDAFDTQGRAFGPSVPAVLSNPRAYRARLCILFLAEHPGSSNGEVAAGIGVRRKGQISALLARLARGGLVLKTVHGPGQRNEWHLSAHGELASEALRALSASGVHCRG